jgi:2-polyprenyl-3-methyl-5-hydroxy-6-metoxy-1,4-benzoquinol methylase
MSDRSNGYDALAADFIAGRTRSTVGAATVREWSKALPRGAAVLDLGCGHGVPISQVLVDEGFDVYGVDASARLIAAFQERFPNARAEVSAVEDSAFFDRTFDGIVSWGLMFLLAPETQATVIHKAARALKPGGRFMFTAPWQTGTWNDLLTGRLSTSLGREAYQQSIAAAGLTLEGDRQDEGDNYYYLTVKP